MKNLTRMGSLVAVLAAGIVTAMALTPTQAGKLVSDSEAATMRAGGCVKYSYGTCSAGACSSQSVILLGTGSTKATPRGTQYCGGSSSCGNYWRYVVACVE